MTARRDALVGEMKRIWRWFRDQDGRLQDREKPEDQPQTPTEGESARTGQDGGLPSENQEIGRAHV